MTDTSPDATSSPESPPSSLPTGPTSLGQASQASRARWGMIAALIVQLSTVASTIVPARYLSPREFALVAAGTVVAGLFGIVADGGYGQALVTGDRADQVRISSTFWSALGVSSAMAIVIAVTAPWTASVIGNAEATPYIAATGVLLPLGVVMTVVQSVHFRRFNHRIVYIGQIVQAIATAVIPIILVVNGVGAWALVFGRVAGALSIVIVLMVFGKVWPSFVFDKQVVIDDLAFNTGALGNNVMTYGSKNLDYWVLGHFVGGAAFGAYYVAFVLPQVIRQRGTWLSQQLLFPVLARLTNNEAQFRSTYLSGLQLVAAFVMPALIGVSVAADLVVDIAFGSQWTAAIGPLRLLGIASTVDVVSAVGITVFLSRREMQSVAKQQLVRLGALAVGLIAVPITRDIRAAAAAVLFSAVVGGFATARAMKLRNITTPSEQFRTLLPVIVPTILMVVGVEAFRWVVRGSLGTIAEIVAVAVVGGVVYLGSGLLLYRSTFREFLRRASEISGVRRLARRAA